MRAIALVLAAGSGSRHGPSPKQYRTLLGQPVLRHALARLLAHPAISGVRAVIGAGDVAAYEAATAGLDLPPPVLGGTTRQASARAGLEAIAGETPDAVLIHDAARPILPHAVIDRLLAALVTAEAAIPVLPVTDTIRRAVGQATSAVPRDNLHRVQTPQAFRFPGILAAHRAAMRDHSDDAALIESLGGQVRLVEGDERLLKITQPGDIARLEALAGGIETRVGTGFDVHRLTPGRKLVLCGIEVPYAQGLAGHSDADVGIHALCDAIYGALGAGDIGTHFPPSQVRWKDSDSALFLRHAAALVAASAGRIVNADVTLICEAPRIGPHAPAMRQRLAVLLGIELARVGVKATTTEQLGFAGRREGIAAQAAVSIAVPGDFAF
jgi:2-C-methyl-D-erythritol 4-phosphate cytidylyltransferase/2-C-methyl-D-erythritol 2,4-cyclodiphosphate synthase